MTYHEQHRPEYLEGLKTFLRIPSISTLSEHKPDIRRAADFVLNELRAAGLDSAALIEGEGNPLVYAEWLGAPDKPTLLLYGHYDVQPPDPLDEWTSPPFEPAVRGENIYARGASDDKGQTYILIKAVAGLLHTTGRLPINVKFLIEGEEETGGEHISAYVEHHPDRLRADAAVICDTEMFAPELPTLCVGLRGIVYGELQVEGAAQDLHSGVYGGAAPNPLQAVAEILCSLKDRDGRIRIPGFYDRVVPPSDKERDAWARLPFDEAAYTRDEMGARELVGEPDVPLLERLWARPTLEVHGIRGGFIGEGAKTVIPARAVAKLSARLVAEQVPDEAAAQIAAAVRDACPRGVTAEFRPFHSAAPSLVNPENTFIRTAAEAMRQVFGRETVYIRSGGSIPIVGLFDKYLGIPSVMMGFGLPDDKIHAPNEKLYLPNFYRGIEAVGRYLEMLGSPSERKPMNDRFLNKVSVSDRREAMRNSLRAALQHNKTYIDNVSQADRKAFRSAWGALLVEEAKKYNQPVTDTDHCRTIAHIAEALSQRYKHILASGRMRFGTAQKAFNLYLKFLWRLGHLPKPPHCPVDSVVLRAAGVEGSWTTSDSDAEYLEWIGALRKSAATSSLADWEYAEWNRNA